MQRLHVYEMVSLDGFIADADGDMSWAHKHDPEFDAYVSDNARGSGTLMFGRTTYDMMASFWPTPMAAQAMPVVAERMNAAPKVVFSRTLTAPAWTGTRVVQGDVGEVARALKNEPGAGITVMGSASIVAELARARVVDAWTFVVNPIVLGKGLSMFGGLDERLDLRLKSTRAFANGNVVLAYEA